MSALDYTYRHNTFCGHSCAASINNIGLARNTHRTVPRFECKMCRASTKNKNFCSHRCQITFNWELRKKQIAADNFPVFNGPHGESLQRRVARKYLREVRGWKCEICDLTEWNGQEAPMILDHKDGNGYDFTLSNIRLVCPNCSALLPTFTSRNRGKGRLYRRKNFVGMAQTATAPDL